MYSYKILKIVEASPTDTATLQDYLHTCQWVTVTGPIQIIHEYSWYIVELSKNFLHTVKPLYNIIISFKPTHERHSIADQ